jgi:hypothetical protein
MPTLHRSQIAGLRFDLYAQRIPLKRQYDLQIQKLNDFFDDARKYKSAKSANMPGFKPDLKFEAMIPVLDGKVPCAVSASRERGIKDAIAWAEKQRIKIVILQPREIGKAAADLKAKNVPVILGRVLALPENEDSDYDEAFTLPAEAHKAGVKFAFGTFNNEFIRNLPYQAATAVSFGLPQAEALKALTINPAQIWGVSDQVGSVEKGKWADLMVTDGDPLEIVTHVKRLFIGGGWRDGLLPPIEALPVEERATTLAHYRAFRSAAIVSRGVVNTTTKLSSAAPSCTGGGAATCSRVRFQSTDSKLQGRA